MLISLGAKKEKLELQMVAGKWLEQRSTFQSQHGMTTLKTVETGDER